MSNNKFWYRSESSLREELAQSYKVAEMALEKGHTRIYERNMSVVYEIETELEKRKPKLVAW